MIDTNVCFFGCGKIRSTEDDPRFFDKETDLVCKDCREIEHLVTNMGVPEFRTHDFGWLRRNLGINFSEHPDFDQVSKLLEAQTRKI
jgi:hypothetical protein